MKFKEVLVLLGVAVMLTGCGADGKKAVDSGTETESIVESTDIVGAGVGAIDVDTEESSVVDESSIEEETTEVIIDELEPRLIHDIQKSAELLDAQTAERENMMVSGLSLDMALGLATNGAGGETLSQLEGYLEMPVDAYNKYVSSLISGLPDEMHIANSVWVNDDYTVKDEYSSTVKENFNVEVETIDVSDSTGSANRINDWVADNTNDMIKQLINDSAINPMTYAVLVNAVCFEDKWREDFDDIVEDWEFTNIDDSVSYVPMLKQSGEGRYYENDTLTAFIKEYKNDRYEFIGVLPKSEGDMLNKSISELEIDKLMSEDWKTCENVNIAVPEFEFEYDVKDIIKVMKEQGVELPFEVNADFSGIADADLSISDIIQKTKVKVDREGTQAAAATSVMIEANAIIPDEPKEEVNIICDRPFVFMIFDRYTNTVAFMGKVVKL